MNRCSGPGEGELSERGGWFLVIGPRYAGEVTEDKTAVLERSSR